MATRKTTDETVEVVELAEEDAPEVEAEAPAPVAAPAEPATPPGGNPLLAQKRVKGRPNNTWRLYYGGLRIDCVEGVEREFPEEIYEYLKKSGNILPPNF